MDTKTTERSGFAEFLRNWRHRRRMSQLDLAIAANISQKHISFLESGRSNPSRISIANLGYALEMPATEGDTMLVLAGFTAQSDYLEWNAADRKAIETSLDHVLQGHNPYPAFVIDRLWNLQNIKESAMAFFQFLRVDDDPNLLRAIMKPSALRDKITNWGQCTRILMQLFEREVARRPSDREARELLEELYSIKDVKTATQDPAQSPPPAVMTLRMQFDDTELSLFSLIATIGMSADAQLDDLRIETLLPADDATRNWFQNHIR